MHAKPATNRTPTLFSVVSGECGSRLAWLRDGCRCADAREVVVMTFSRTVGAASLLGFLALLGAGPVLAQSDQEDVPLIMLKPQGAGALSGPHLQKLYAAIKKRSTKARGQVLPLTKTEVWMVPKDNVEDVRKAAARQGVLMSRLGATWSHVFHKASADAKVSDKQKSMMDRAKASAATMGVG